MSPLERTTAERLVMLMEQVSVVRERGTTHHDARPDELEALRETIEVSRAHFQRINVIPESKKNINFRNLPEEALNG